MNLYMYNQPAPETVILLTERQRLGQCYYVPDIIIVHPSPMHKSADGIANLVRYMSDVLFVNYLSPLICVAKVGVSSSMKTMEEL